MRRETKDHRGKRREVKKRRRQEEDDDGLIGARRRQMKKYDRMFTTPFEGDDGIYY